MVRTERLFEKICMHLMCEGQGGDGECGCVMWRWSCDFAQAAALEKPCRDPRRMGWLTRRGRPGPGPPDPEAPPATPGVSPRDGGKMQEATEDGQEPILNGAGREEVSRGRVLAHILWNFCVSIYTGELLLFSTNCVRHRKTVTTCAILTSVLNC